MQTRLYLNKIHVWDLTNQEKMYLRRNGVNVSVKNGTFIMEDNIYNRALLSLDMSEISRDISEFNTDVNVKSRDYQTRDITRSLSSKYVLNVNKPGYGKTFEAIEYCRLKNLKRILVVAPKSVVAQWQEQFNEWWPEVADSVMIFGNGPKRAQRSIYITNYEQFGFHRKRGSRSQGCNNGGGAKKKEELVPSPVWVRCKEWVWDVIILDESHRIKSPKALTTLAIKQLPSARRMCLTGTPILRKPDDLWSQLQFLDEKLSGGSYWAFAERFCEIDVNNFGKKPVGLTPSVTAQKLLGDALASITIGGENHKVTSGKNIIPIEIPMYPKQRNLYKQVLNLALDELDKQGVTVKNAMDQMIKLQQISSNCGMFNIDNPKFEWIIDWLDDNEGEKIVVFTKFAETAKSLYAYLTSKKIGSMLYIGEMSATARTESKERFTQVGCNPATGLKDECRVLIGTIGALGTGVDGLQDVCRNVVFVDRDWSPALNEQAEQRIDRPTRIWIDKGMTSIWILNAKHSMDAHVEEVNGKKASDIEEVFKRVIDSLGSGE